MAYASKSYTPFPAEKKIQYKIIHAGVTFFAYSHFCTAKCTRFISTSRQQEWRLQALD